MSRSMIMVLLALFGLSCHSGGHSTGSASHEMATHGGDHAKRDLASLEIINFRMPSDHMVTGGQLTQEQMVALQEEGYGTFINLRPVYWSSDF